MTQRTALDWFVSLCETAAAIEAAAEALESAVGCEAIEKAVTAHEDGIDTLVDLVCGAEGQEARDALLDLLSIAYSEA